MVLMSIELILNAVNINLVAFSALTDNIAGEVFALFVIAIAGAEVGVGLGNSSLIFRNKKNVDLSEIDQMKDEHGKSFNTRSSSTEVRANRLVSRNCMVDTRTARALLLPILFFGKKMKYKGAEFGITLLHLH